MASVVSPLLELQQLVRNIESSHHGDTLGADDATPIPDFTGFLIQIPRGKKQLMLLLLSAGHRILFAKNLDFDRGIRFTHAWTVLTHVWERML